jgi:hypothetical protein
MSAGGEVRWPPLGRNRWPLTLGAAVRLGSPERPDSDYVRCSRDLQAPAVSQESARFAGILCIATRGSSRGPRRSRPLARGTHVPSAIGTSFGTLRASVARSSSLDTRCSVKKTGRLAGTSCDGETRTRTGDTTIFRRAVQALESRENSCKQRGCARAPESRTNREFRSVLDDSGDGWRPVARWCGSAAGESRTQRPVARGRWGRADRGGIVGAAAGAHLEPVAEQLERLFPRARAGHCRAYVRARGAAPPHLV